MNNNCVVDSSVQHRFLLLDGLRGIAALMVLGYHLFEAIAFAANAPEQHMFHGFLAVDFFFILSGFVMGYAYDKRWNSMTIGQFIRLRLIRLHPMINYQEQQHNGNQIHFSSVAPFQIFGRHML